MPRTHAGRPLHRRVVVLLLGLLVFGTSACLSASDGGDRVVTDTVRIPGAWVFEPEHIEVANGTAVTWTNDGGQPHTVTFSSLGHDETIEPGGTVTLTFATPGTYTYTCRFHPPDMTGTVRVVENTENGTAGP